jgi:hypothetical protein
VAKTRNFAVIILSIGSLVGSLADALTRTSRENSAEDHLTLLNQPMAMACANQSQLDVIEVTGL